MEGLCVAQHDTMRGWNTGWRWDESQGCGVELGGLETSLLRDVIGCKVAELTGECSLTMRW